MNTYAASKRSYGGEMPCTSGGGNNTNQQDERRWSFLMTINNTDEPHIES